jgi:hypothetical protein
MSERYIGMPTLEDKNNLIMSGGATVKSPPRHLKYPKPILTTFRELKKVDIVLVYEEVILVSTTETSTIPHEHREQLSLVVRTPPKSISLNFFFFLEINFDPE